MHGLEQGITQLANYEMNAKVRSNAVSLLNGIIDDLNAAIDVWSGFQKSGKLSSAPGSFGGWAGFSIEKKLFEMDLSAREKAKLASAGKSSLDDPVVVLAYSKLGDSESADDRCKSAIDELRNRIGKINELIELINSTKPKKAAATAEQKPVEKASAKKTSGGKKAAKKKATAGKPKKKAAKTKVKTKAKTKSKKKAVKKKSAGKTSGKKTTKKKAAKKKSTKTKSKKKAKRR